MKKRVKKYWAVVRSERWEGPDEIILYLSERTAVKNCPINDEWRVIGPLEAGKPASLYG